MRWASAGLSKEEAIGGARDQFGMFAENHPLPPDQTSFGFKSREKLDEVQ